MKNTLESRRSFLAAAGALVAGSAAGLSIPASAQTYKATKSMRGGSNNYRAGAEVVERIGGGGFWMTGTVCLLYTSPSPRDQRGSRMPSSA